MIPPPPPRQRPRIPLYRKLLYAVVPLLALEAGARLLPPPERLPVREYFTLDYEDPYHVKDPVLFWRLRPEVTAQREGPEGGYRWVTNRQGLREPHSIPRKKAKGSYRILCIGDSVPFGWLVDREESYPFLLKRLLADRPGRYEVINAGVPGYSSYQMLIFLREELLDFEPDLVIAYVGINDSSGALVTDTVRSWVIWLDGLGEGLALYQHVRAWLAAVRSPVREIKEAAAYPAVRVYMEDFLENLRQIRRLCQEKGARLLLVRAPVYWQGEMSLASPPARRPEDTVELEEEYWRIADKDLSLDLRPALAEATRDPKELLVEDDPCHWNPRGHWIVAKELVRVMESAGLIPEKGPPASSH